MCCGCWKEAESPRIDNEKVRAALVLVEAVYDYHAAGGHLHCMLDDMNVDGDFAFEQDLIDKGGYGDTSPEDLATEQACLDAFKALTIDERYSVLGLHAGCWKRQP